MDDLVSAQEIADLLELSGTSTVHEWARRHASFPQPVTVLSIGKVWSWADVRAWCVEHGRLGADDRPIRLKGGRPRVVLE